MKSDEANDMEAICGVTTNPSLIAKRAEILLKLLRKSQLL